RRRPARCGAVDARGAAKGRAAGGDRGDEESPMTRLPRKLVTRAHGKVNLDLRVLGTRQDGFHELRTVFQAIELHDTLTSVLRPGPFAVKCNMPGVPLDEGNLVWRAAAGLW